jgi:hypothetical protein
MCRYLIFANPCGCFGPIKTDFSVVCPFVMEQLLRIHEPAAWEGDAVNQIPFDCPPRCDYSRDNMTVFQGEACIIPFMCPAVLCPEHPWRLPYGSSAFTLNFDWQGLEKLARD